MNGIHSVVAVGAHADDLELGCFGTLALFKERGAQVTLVVMTTTPSIDHLGNAYRTDGPTDVQAGARILGIDRAVTLAYRNNEIPYGVESIQELNRIFDERQADLILTHWVWDNQQDHQHTAKAVISAARHYSNIMMFEPNPGRPAVSTVPFRPSIYVDISAFLDLKLRAIRAHRSEYERLGGDQFFHMWESRARLRGAEIRTEAAEAFEPIKLVANSLLGL